MSSIYDFHYFYCKLYDHEVNKTYCHCYCPFFEDVKSCPREYEKYSKMMKERFEKKNDREGT